MGKGNERSNTMESKKSSKLSSAKPQTVSSKSIKTNANAKSIESDDIHFIVCGCGGSYMNIKFDPNSGSPRLRHCNTSQHIDWVKNGDPNNKSNNMWNNRSYR